MRLVVGKINLVEKIAELARLTFHEDNDEAKDSVVSEKKLRKEALKRAMEAPPAPAAAAPMSGAKPQEPKEVAKEGLSEYFIYTIEGTETIRNGWSKRMRSIESPKVPLKIQYRYRPAEYGDELVRMLLMTNDKDSKLGATPLPDGEVRGFPPECGRLELPRFAVGQVHSDRRQDRTESRARSRGAL